MANERVPFTVAGQNATIKTPYKEGHQLTALEADALNQTWRENIRNGIANKVKEAVKAKASGEAIQKIVDEYAEKYQFSKRGGQRLDPVMAEAKRLAKMQIDKKLAERGMSKKEFAAYDDRVAKLMEHPKILEIAKSVVAHRKVQQDLVDDKSRKQSTPTDNTDDGQMSLQNGLDNGLRQTGVLRSISIIAKALNAMVARVRRFGQRGLVASNGERTAA
ncbi:MAG: hypothetical protein OXU62_12875 [Gammaproteobacteria bacterium]|nr:hypothetical protein [Gammaproteobacteria bacterium]